MYCFSPRFSGSWVCSVRELSIHLKLLNIKNELSLFIPENAFNLTNINQADILGMAVIVPEEKESVLLGAAMLGMSAASGGCLVEVTRNISMSSTQVSPCPEVEQYHEAKYKVFKEMIEDQLKYRKIMKQYEI